MTKYTQSSKCLIVAEDITSDGTQVGSDWYYRLVDVANFQAVLDQGATEITEQEYKSALGV